MSEKLVRLDRLLVMRGLGSRRSIQRLIKRGEVSLEGEVITRPEFRLSQQSELSVSGEVSRPLPLLIAYHKPLGQLSTLRDPWGREGLDRALPPQWRELFHPVGRLDADTSGLLLFSSDGGVTQRLLHPKREIPRSYLAHIHALPEELTESLSAGVDTSLGRFTATVERIDRLTPQSPRPQGAEDAVATITLSVCEGKHRMVRRMLHNAGASVLALHRVSYGPVKLTKGVPEAPSHTQTTDTEVDQETLSVGAWREVSADELSALEVSFKT